MTWSVIEGDCIEVMAEMAEDSVDAVVTDPPYGLEFMGKEWDRLDWRDGGGFSKPGIGDRATSWTSFGGETANPTCATCGGRARGKRTCSCEAPEWRVKGEPMDDRAAVRSRMMQDWHHAWALEAVRVLKPGGHLLAFGGTRTYHRLTCALEDAGFEVRDCLAWLYGSGFPKSLDVSKAIDKAAGIHRGKAGSRVSENGAMAGPNYERTDKGNPITAAAAAAAGLGTALKPAFEPVVLARKPLSERNVAANVQRWGTGAINVDGCRIEHTPEDEGAWGLTQNATPGSDGQTMGEGWAHRSSQRHDLGRWPANVVLDEEAAAMLDEQSGERSTSAPGAVVRRRSAAEREGNTGSAYGAESRPEGAVAVAYGDTGGASRFFYTAKASRSEREAGMRDYMPDKGEDPLLWSSGETSPGTFQAEGTSRKARNHHPTVKPVDLMCWLVRLVTPPGGTVLDPFLGSGSTGIAALREGFDFIGIEREPGYVEIARARIVGDAPMFNVPGEVSA